VVTEIQWYTGKKNISNVGQYSLVNGLNYLTTNYSKFNGNESYWVLESPWAEKDYFYGTNGKKFKPDQYGTRNVSIYVPNLQRYGTSEVTDTESYTRYGYQGELNLLPEKMYLSMYDNPDNAKYYQTYYGFFNETSVIGAPFFMSKHYLVNSTENWTTLVDFYTEKEELIKATDSHWQSSYVISEVPVAICSLTLGCLSSR
jgi:hypothetical protein